MASPAETDCKRILITGRVQGVGFRASTRQKAQSLGLKGWVRNLPDDRVEVLAWGPRSAVQRLVRWCHSGPSYAHVTSVEVRDAEPEPSLNHFAIRSY